MIAGYRVLPADEAGFAAVATLFGARGAAARCRCQRYKLYPHESFGGQPVELRAERLRAQVEGEDTDGGLVRRAAPRAAAHVPRGRRKGPQSRPCDVRLHRGPGHRCLASVIEGSTRESPVAAARTAGSSSPSAQVTELGGPRWALLRVTVRGFGVALPPA